MAPSILLPLLDARVSLRKEAGLVSRATKNAKWSSVQPHVTQMISDAVEHFPHAAAIQHDVGRYATPNPRAPLAPRRMFPALPPTFQADAMGITKYSKDWEKSFPWLKEHG